MDFDLRPGPIIQDLALKRPIMKRPRHMATSAARIPTLRGRKVKVGNVSCFCFRRGEWYLLYGFLISISSWLPIFRA